MRTFRKVLLTLGLLLLAEVAALAQGTVKGTIVDAKTKEPLPFVAVVAKQDGQQIRGNQTNMDGQFTIKPLPVGKYDIEVSSVGYHKYVRQGLQVNATGFTICDVELQPASVTLDDVVIVDTKQPIIDMKAPESGQTLTPDDIARMPSNSIDAIVAVVGGVGYNDGGTATARGEGNMVQMQGNVRKHSGVSVPKEAIAEIKVILGGTPASIGEAVGGTQIITLKPPTRDFKGNIRWDSYLDYRFANSLVLYLTGPLVMKEEKDETTGSVVERPLIGYRLSGQLSYTNYPLYKPRGYRYQLVDDELVRQLEQKPLSYDPLTGVINYAGETSIRGNNFHEITRLRKKDFGGDASRVPNLQSYGVSLEGTLDFRFSDYATLGITGQFSASHSPSVSVSPLTMSLMGSTVSEGINYGITLDFTQRFKDPENNGGDEEGSSRAISNVMYNLTAMYERSASKSYNEVYGSSIDDIFKYGHVGKFRTDKIRTYDEPREIMYNGVATLARVQNAWADRITYLEGDENNSILANYNEQLFKSEEFADVQPYLYTRDNVLQFKGLMNGDSPSSIYGMLTNVGVRGGSYSLAEAQYLYMQAKASADIYKHEVEVGFQYDQSWSSSYSIAAYGIWTLMRQNANRHILQMDLDKPHYRQSGSLLYVDYERKVDYAQQTPFDAAFRTFLGAADTTFIDIDYYDPQDFVDAGGIEMFSANELFNSGSPYVSYAGYDHTGKKYNSSKWTLEEFFNPTGNKNYQYLPAFSPIYMAGYVQDRFYFQDLIFNVGVRVDYFDGNQWVMKDPYLLYESYTVGDLRRGAASYEGDLYAGAGDDWVPYVNQVPDAGTNSRPSIVGYRDQNGNWYNAQGVQVDSPNAVKGNSGKPTPYRTPRGQETMQNNSVSVEGVFERYKPQIVPQPRIAFSFPVGDNSQFKANFDIIARRPQSSWAANYYQYLYMSQYNSITNPNLKPERITNYELGFQQMITSSMAISASAYYKETRDLIQYVQYAGADPNMNYYSLDNQDFHTIKGLTISYDMRQNKNIRVNANYTLQYAEGSGLSASTMTELIKEGYTTLKMLNPIYDDRRHEFKANIDFRYGSGKNYNGPRFTRAVTDKDGQKTRKEILPLENFGVNIVAVAQSGRPYTKQFSHTQSTIVGGYNGARLPWGFYFDLVVDKSWPIKVGKRETYLSAALIVNNVFNIRNIVNVHAVTGNPEDDGYLTDPETQQTINSQIDPLAYREIYSILLKSNTWNYSTPRLFRLSLSYSF